jgi:hypothetical protein
MFAFGLSIFSARLGTRLTGNQSNSGLGAITTPNKSAALVGNSLTMSVGTITHPNKSAALVGNSSTGSIGTMSIGSGISGTITVGSANTILSNNISDNALIALDSSKALILKTEVTDNFPDSSVLSISGNTVTNNSEINVYNSAESYFGYLGLLSSTKAIAFFEGSGSSLNAKVLDISGTTVTAGGLATLSGQTTTSSIASVATLSSTKAIGVFIDAFDYVRAAEITISGSTATWGVTASQTTYSANTVKSCALTSTTFLALYTELTDGDLYAVVGTLNPGVSITWGTPVLYNTNIYSYPESIVSLSATKALAAVVDDNGEAFYYVIDVSGTVPTINSRVDSEYNGLSLSYPIDLVRVSNTQAIAVITGDVAGYWLKAVFLTISGSSVTETSDVNIFNTNATHNPRIAKLSDTKYIVTYEDVTATDVLSNILTVS